MLNHKLKRAAALAGAALLAIALLQSCSGSSEPPEHAGRPAAPLADEDQRSTPPAAQLPPANGLPELPGPDAAGPPRGASYQSLYFAWGNAIFDASDDVIYAGDSVTLLSGPGSIGWSTYPFGTGEFQPTDFYVNLSAGSNAPVYVGISDYEKGAWRFYGPYLSSASVDLPLGQYQNASGQCFIAVVVFGGSSVSVNHLYVLTDNGQPAGQTISGLVKDENNSPLAGIKLNCDAPGFPEVYTDSVGGYEFNDIPDGSYTVQPDMFDTFTSSFSFTPPSQPVTLTGAGQNGVNFTGERHDVIGRVKLTGGKGVAGVLMTLNPGGSTTTTAGDGSYFFPAVADGAYTVTPLLSGYSFDPTDVNAVVAGADAEVADIVATGGAPTYTLTGHIYQPVDLPIPGVVVTLVPTWQTAITDSNGDFAFNDVAAASYTLTPGLGAFEFTPLSRGVTVVDSDVSGLDFEGYLPIMHEASGLIHSAGGHGIPAMAVKVWDKATQQLIASTFTDSTGIFSVQFPEVPVIQVTAEHSGMETMPYYEERPGTSDQFGLALEAVWVNGVGYNNFIQTYISNNCLSCHSTTASNPVNPMLQTYAQASANSGSSNARIQADTMPPGGGNNLAYKEWFDNWTDNGAPED